MSEPQQHPTASWPILLAALGILVAVLLLVWILFPTIVARSPMGDVIRESEIAYVLADVPNVKTALEGMLDNAGVQSFAEFFDDPASFYKETVAETVDYHSEIAYALLIEGNSAKIGMKPSLAQRLAPNYIELKDGAWNDPWGNRYRFYFGPWDAARHGEADENGDGPPFRSYFDVNRKQNLQGIAPDASVTILIYSLGRDGLSSQLFGATPHDTIEGDDIGSWVGN